MSYCLAAAAVVPALDLKICWETDAEIVHTCNLQPSVVCSITNDKEL